MSDTKLRAARASLEMALNCGSVREMRTYVEEALQLLEAAEEKEHEAVELTRDGEGRSLN